MSCFIKDHSVGTNFDSRLALQAHSHESQAGKHHGHFGRVRSLRGICLHRAAERSHST